MKARSRHAQLQRYTRNWATHEIMKTLLKNKRSYKKRIASENSNRDSFMEDGEGLEGDGDEGKDEDEEGNEEENSDNYKGEGNTNEEEDMYVEEGENAKEFEEGNSFERNDDEEVRNGVDDWEAAAGFGATMSQSAPAAAKKSKKSATTSKKSVGKMKLKPAAVRLAGTKRKVPEDDHEDDIDGVRDIDQVAAVAPARRNPARNMQELKRSRL